MFRASVGPIPCQKQAQATKRTIEYGRRTTRKARAFRTGIYVDRRTKAGGRRNQPGHGQFGPHEPLAARRRRVREDDRCVPCTAECGRSGRTGSPDGSDGNPGSAALRQIETPCRNSGNRPGSIDRAGTRGRRRKREKLTGSGPGAFRFLSEPTPCFRRTSNSVTCGWQSSTKQHRFGVKQRLGLSAKGNAIDVMVMSATPIPRSLALACYGDMDVSILDEKPPGRRPGQNGDCLAKPNGERDQPAENQRLNPDASRIGSALSLKKAAFRL